MRGFFRFVTILLFGFVVVVVLVSFLVLGVVVVVANVVVVVVVVTGKTDRRCCGIVVFGESCPRPHRVWPLYDNRQQRHIGPISFDNTLTPIRRVNQHIPPSTRQTMVHRNPIHSIVPLFFLGLGLFPCSTTAFVAVARPGSIALVAPTTTATTTTRAFQKSRRLYNNKKDDDGFNEDGTRKKNFLESILDPYPTKIPLEFKDEIYAAEANTPAAQNRSTRQWIYGAGGSFCFLLGFVNVFLTELRHRNEGMTNTDMGFAAVDDNPLLHIVFATKIGGYLLLALGAAAGFLFEAEVRVAREKRERELKQRCSIVVWSVRVFSHTRVSLLVV